MEFAWVMQVGLHGSANHQEGNTCTDHCFIATLPLLVLSRWQGGAWQACIVRVDGELPKHIVFIVIIWPQGG